MLTWKPHHTYSPATTQVDGLLVADDGYTCAQFDFETCRDEDLHVDVLMEAVSAWTAGSVHIYRPYEGSPETAVVPESTDIPEALQRLGYSYDNIGFVSDTRERIIV